MTTLHVNVFFFLHLLIFISLELSILIERYTAVEVSRKRRTKKKNRRMNYQFRIIRWVRGIVAFSIWILMRSVKTVWVVRSSSLCKCLNIHFTVFVLDRFWKYVQKRRKTNQKLNRCSHLTNCVRTELKLPRSMTRFFI